jgi:hypothetical protein
MARAPLESRTRRWRCIRGNKYVDEGHENCNHPAPNQVLPPGEQSFGDCVRTWNDNQHAQPQWLRHPGPSVLACVENSGDKLCGSSLASTRGRHCLGTDALKIGPRPCEYNVVASISTQETPSVKRWMQECSAASYTTAAICSQLTAVRLSGLEGAMQEKATVHSGPPLLMGRMRNQDTTQNRTSRRNDPILPPFKPRIGCRRERSPIDFRSSTAVHYDRLVPVPASTNTTTLDSRRNLIVGQDRRKRHFQRRRIPRQVIVIPWLAHTDAANFFPSFLSNARPRRRMFPPGIESAVSLPSDTFKGRIK